MTVTPQTRVCNCGACGLLLGGKNEIGRRIAHGARVVPLCGECGQKRDREAIYAIETWDMRQEG